MPASADDDATDRHPALTRAGLKTPRAAALAGILFALLFSSSIVMIRLAVPPDLADHGAWLRERGTAVGLALALLPVAGIAFLWFMGVVRDRIGFGGSFATLEATAPGSFRVRQPSSSTTRSTSPS